MNTAKLIYKNDYLVISDFIYNQEDEYYNTSFVLEVRSGCFSGIAPCEYEINEFRKFVCELSKMYDFQQQVVILNDICYGSTVKFEMDKTGHVEISGEIFGEAAVHSLQFSFVVDQSVLKQFIFELQKIISD